ncbi:mechanosensitive ion channel domain-containing protein [Clostridium sp. UBA1056]|uniref:mechanosensitive ion channel family protein n=1 Tax=unclassified Clostridium TaxID=2614128 RepID=UPI0032179997
MDVLENLIEKLIAWVATNGIKLIVGLIALWIGWKLISKLIKIMNAILEKKNVDITLRKFLDGFVSLALRILLIIVIMECIGVETSGLAAIIASAGLAIGLALQGSLSNFAGGIIILLIRPFNVGDFIEGAGQSGVVEKIGIFYTQLTTGDNKQILVPNGKLSNDSVINYSAKETRRVDLKFSVGYEEDVVKVKKVLEGVIKTEELILKEPAPFIALSEHADSSINFVVRVWCKTEDYWTIYFNLLEKVKIKFDEEKIEIPYPQVDLHLNHKSELGI